TSSTTEHVPAVWTHLITPRLVTQKCLPKLELYPPSSSHRGLTETEFMAAKKTPHATGSTTQAGSPADSDRHSPTVGPAGRVHMPRVPALLVPSRSPKMSRSTPKPPCSSPALKPKCWLGSQPLPVNWAHQTPGATSAVLP